MFSLLKLQTTLEHLILHLMCLFCKKLVKKKKTSSFLLFKALLSALGLLTPWTTLHSNIKFSRQFCPVAQWMAKEVVLCYYYPARGQKKMTWLFIAPPPFWQWWEFLAYMSSCHLGNAGKEKRTYIHKQQYHIYHTEGVPCTLLYFIPVYIYHVAFLNF